MWRPHTASQACQEAWSCLKTLLASRASGKGCKHQGSMNWVVLGGILKPHDLEYSRKDIIHRENIFIIKFPNNKVHCCVLLHLDFQAAQEIQLKSGQSDIAMWRHTFSKRKILPFPLSTLNTLVPLWCVIDWKKYVTARQWYFVVLLSKTHFCSGKMFLLLSLSIQYDLAKSMYGAQALLWNPDEVCDS